MLNTNSKNENKEPANQQKSGLFDFLTISMIGCFGVYLISRNETLSSRLSDVEDELSKSRKATSQIIETHQEIIQELDETLKVLRKNKVGPENE